MNPLREAIRSSAMGPVTQDNDGGAALRYCFPDDFIGFSGHFPGHPVLPAVVQIWAALLVVEEMKGRPLELAAVEKAKFLLELHPGEEILVEVQDRPKGDRPGCEARLLAAGKVAATFYMAFEGAVKTGGTGLR